MKYVPEKHPEHPYKCALHFIFRIFYTQDVYERTVYQMILHPTRPTSQEYSSVFLFRVSRCACFCWAGGVFLVLKSLCSLKVNALLPTDTFIMVVRGLMSNQLPSVRRKAMELLNNRLQQRTRWEEQQVHTYINFLAFMALNSVGFFVVFLLSYP